MVNSLLSVTKSCIFTQILPYKHDNLDEELGSADEEISSRAAHGTLAVLDSALEPPVILWLCS